MSSKMEDYDHSSLHEIQTQEMDEINFDVLHPENPLMIRFQNALSQMLEKKLGDLQDDLNEVQHEIKQKRQEKDDLCEILYHQKSELLKLENEANQYNESISEIIEKRKRLKTDVSRNTEKNEKLLQALDDEKRLNNDLRCKIEGQSHVLNQLQKYEQNEASNLRIIQQAIARNKADQVLYLKEKIQKDYLLMKLENEVFKNELLIKSYKEQTDAQCENLAKLQKELESKNCTFENVLQDNSQLLKVWKNMVALISKRDEEYSNLKMQLDKTDISHKEKIIEMKSYKEMGEKEMLRNEILTLDRNRKKSFSNALGRRQIDMDRKLNITEHELMDLQNMIECTEKNLEETKKMQADYERDVLLLENRLRKLTNEKYELEENIISQLQNEVVSNNATVKLNEDICKLRQTSLQLELQIKELSSNYFQTCTTLEQDMKALDASRGCLENKKIEIRDKEKELSKIEEELKNLTLSIKKEENRLDDDCKQLEKLTEDPNACPELDDKESRLEEMLKNVTNEIEGKKQLWVQMQNEIMNMTEKKNSLSSELGQLNQHLNVLRQKNLKIDRNLKKHNEDNAKLDKTITHILDYISRLNSECSSQKEHENILDSENCTIQNKAMEKLHNAENEVLAIIQEINDFKNKKESLEKDLLDIQRKDLEWDKKVKLANEMKQEILAEQSEKGDIGSMKTEIHRMEIRYAQLKKAQESLVSNLETCVSKRGRIFDDVLLKNKKESDALKEQQKMIRHINVLKSKNLKLREKLDSFQKEHVELCSEKEKLSEEIRTCEDQIEAIKTEINNLDEKISQYHLLKHKNLEVLIRKQKFADFLSQIKSSKTRTMTTNEATIERDYLKHQYLRQDLLDTVESVMKECPEFRNDLSRITNVLESLCE